MSETKLFVILRALFSFSFLFLYIAFSFITSGIRLFSHFSLSQETPGEHALTARVPWDVENN
jgi:hypothetical protein